MKAALTLVKNKRAERGKSLITLWYQSKAAGKGYRDTGAN